VTACRPFISRLGIGTTLGELAQLAVAARLKRLEIRVGPGRNFDGDRFVGDPGWPGPCSASLAALASMEDSGRLVREYAEASAARRTQAPELEKQDLDCGPPR
jgi:hypothetical protein